MKPSLNPSTLVEDNVACELDIPRESVPNELFEMMDGGIWIRRWRVEVGFGGGPCMFGLM